MKHILHTIWYFVAWGIFYGLYLGIWSTAIILPIFGGIFGAFWGPGVGAACGLLCGVLVGLIQAATFHEDVDLVRYGRGLAVVVGLLVAVAAPYILLLTTRGMLWNGYGFSDIPQVPYMIHSLAAASFWGGLSAAFIASR